MADLLSAALSSRDGQDPRVGAALLWAADVGEAIRGIALALVHLGKSRSAG